MGSKKKKIATTVPAGPLIRDRYTSQVTSEITLKPHYYYNYITLCAKIRF